jgi:hypothetical protein
MNVKLDETFSATQYLAHRETRLELGKMYQTLMALPNRGK